MWLEQILIHLVVVVADVVDAALKRPKEEEYQSEAYLLRCPRFVESFVEKEHTHQSKTMMQYLVEAQKSQ
jgi:hypothetical protein